MAGDPYGTSLFLECSFVLGGRGKLKDDHLMAGSACGWLVSYETTTSFPVRSGKQWTCSMGAVSALPGILLPLRKIVGCNRPWGLARAFVGKDGVRLIPRVELLQT